MKFLNILSKAFVFCVVVGVLLLISGRANISQAAFRDASPSQATTSTYQSNYTMGYVFTPTVNGTITQLWCNGTGGTSSTIALWSEGNVSTPLATATNVNCTSGTWVSANITPVSVTAGQNYRVAQFGSSSYYSTLSIPYTSNNITITGGAFVYAGGTTYPFNNTGSTIYGYADVTFSAGGGSCSYFPGSVIAGGNDETVMSGWLPGKQGTLLYRRSTNGAAPSTFHTLANGQGETLTLYKNTSGVVFGGYNPLSWSSIDNYVAGSGAFLYNLTDDYKLSQTNTTYQTFNYTYYGPTFGGGHDLQSDLVNGTNNPHSYQNPSTYGYSYLGGAYSWTLSEAEVYKLSACSGGGTATLTVTKSGAGGGTVTSNPAGINCGATCSYAFTSGASVVLTATPNGTSTFTGWSGGGCSGTGTCTVTMSSVQNITATFTPITYALNVSKSGLGGGTVTSNDGFISCGATCSHTYNSGSSIVLTATPNGTSTFTGWSGGGCSGTGTCTVTMSAIQNVAANFSVATYALNVSKGGLGGGTVTSNDGFISCGATCSHTYASGSSIVLTATPNGTSMFAGWSGGGCSGTGTCTVAISSIQNVTATFNPTNILTISKPGSGTGTITSNPVGISCGSTCSYAFASGSSVILSAAPSGGGTFTGWSGGGCSGTGACMVTMSSAQTVTANFLAPTYTGTITFYWGSRDQTNCGSGYTVNTRPALEVAIISGTAAFPAVSKYVFDRCNRVTGTLSASSASGTPFQGVTFDSTATIPAITNGLIMKVIPLYNSTIVGIQGSAAFPSQGKVIESTGKSGDSVRKIIYFESYPQIPNEIFPYAILSQ